MNIAIIHQNTETIRLFKFLIKNLGYNNLWDCHDVQQARRLCLTQKPDLVLLQLELGTDHCTDFIHASMSKTPITIIVTSNSQQDNTAAIFDAMSAGALDAIIEPSSTMPQSINDFRIKIKNIYKLLKNITSPVPERNLSIHTPTLIAIGSSTGGPAALLTILQSLPTRLNAIVVVIQHMDDHFSQGMANWLNTHISLDVSIAQNLQTPETGKIYMAGTNDHLTINSLGQFEYTSIPEDYPYRPSVNCFYESALSHWPDKIIGVLLTGMGRDGADGLLSLYNRGMITIAQDEKSCAVYGMPKAACDINAVTYQLDINKIAQKILEHI